MQAPPRRPPTASQVAHWITFKEDQRLEWQKQYLSHLCEADQEIQEANELIQEFTTMLRERKGERFDAWLEKVEQQGIAELRSFAPAEIFRGGAVPASSYSVLLRARFQAQERTLRDDEVATWSQQIIKALETLGGKLRA